MMTTTLMLGVLHASISQLSQHIKELFALHEKRRQRQKQERERDNADRREKARMTTTTMLGVLHASPNELGQHVEKFLALKKRGRTEKRKKEDTCAGMMTMPSVGHSEIGELGQSIKKLLGIQKRRGERKGLGKGLRVPNPNPTSLRRTKQG